MKKIFLSIMLFILSIPLFVNAEEFDVKNFYVNIDVQNNGDAIIEYYFDLNGSYNGYDLKINFKNNNTFYFNSNLNSLGGSELNNGTGIELISIMGVNKNDNFDFINVSGDTFKEVDEASTGKYGVYLYSQDRNGMSLKIFNPSKKKKAFYIKFKIKDLVIEHNDVSELGLNIFTDGFRESIETLKCNINIPFNKNLIKGWAHGADTKINTNSNTKIEYLVKGLKKYTAFDVRTVFDKINAYKKSNIDALDKIVLYEEDEDEQNTYIELQNNYRYYIDAKNYLDIALKSLDRTYYDNAIKLIYKITDTEVDKKEELLKIASDIELKITEREENDAINSVDNALEYGTYYFYSTAVSKVNILTNQSLKRELSLRLNIVKEKLIKDEKKQMKYEMIVLVLIALFDMLIIFSNKKYTKKKYANKFNNKYFRDILDDKIEDVSYLFYKGLRSNTFKAAILELIRAKKIQYEKMDKDEFKLKLLVDPESLPTNESNLVKYLFLEKKEVTSKDLAKNESKRYSKIRKYRKDAIKEAKNKNYFETKCDKKVSRAYFSLTMLMIISIIGLLYTLCTHHFIFYTWIFYFFMPYLPIMSMIVIHDMNERTAYGEDQFFKYKAIKRFLNDFGKFDDKSLPEVHLWDKYLVYATFFGIAKKVEKEMKLRLENMNIDDDLLVTSFNISALDSISSATYSSSYSGGSSSSGSSFSGFSGGGGSFGGGTSGGRF